MADVLRFDPGCSRCTTAIEFVMRMQEAMRVNAQLAWRFEVEFVHPLMNHVHRQVVIDLACDLLQQDITRQFDELRRDLDLPPR